MDELDDRGEHIGVGAGMNAVPEVEDVTRPAGVVGEHVAVPASASSAPASTSAGSRLPCTPIRSPKRLRASEIDVRQSSPIMLGPAATIDSSR